AGVAAGRTRGDFPRMGSYHRTLVLWAWEREEVVRFLEARCTAVVWFAGQVDAKANAREFRPRWHPLEITHEQPNRPVIRVNAHDAAPTDREEQQRRPDFLRRLRQFVAAEHLACTSIGVSAAATFHRSATDLPP